MQRQPGITIVRCVVTKIGECCERIGEIEIDHERRRCSGGWSEPGGAHKNVEDHHLYFGESLVEVGGIENRRNDVEYDGGGQAKKVSYRSQEYGTR